METKEKRAKLFQTGRSQAVRLPKEFRFSGSEVCIRRVGNGVILEPVDHTWEWLETLRKLGPLDDDAVAAALEDVPQQERPLLDKVFR